MIVFVEATDKALIGLEVPPGLDVIQLPKALERLPAGFYFVTDECAPILRLNDGVLLCAPVYRRKL